MVNAVSIFVHVTPRSGRDEVVGASAVAGGVEVRVRVCSPPDGGKANKAVCKLVASALGVPKGAVEVASGAKSRHKRLAVAADPARVEAWLGALPALD